MTTPGPGMADASTQLEQRDVTVLYDADDAERFLKDRPTAWALPLTPAAQGTLAGSDAKILDPLKQHGSYAHLRDMVRGEGLTRYLQAQFASGTGLNKASRHALKEDMIRGCHVSSRIWLTLRGPYRWVIPMASGWQPMSREQAHPVLLQRLMASYARLKEAECLKNSPFNRMRLHWLNRILMKLVAKTQPVFLYKFKRGFGDLVAEMHRENEEQYYFVPRFWDGKADSVATVFSQVRRLMSGRPLEHNLKIAMPCKRMPEKLSILHQLIANIPDPLTRAGVEAIRPRLEASVELCESMAGYLQTYLKDSHAKAVLNFDENYLLSTIMAHTAKQANVPSLLICHTSVTPAQDRLAEKAKSHRTKHLTASPLCDMALVQTPLAEEAVRQFGPEVPTQRVQPFVWGLQAAKTSRIYKQPGAEKIVVHASNYFEWQRYEPWVYETSLEFVANLQALVLAIGTIPDTKLIIRMKPSFDSKGEFTPDTLQRLLPPGNWEIRSEGSIYEDMARADLIAASHSTSLEESLIIGKPVLLIGQNFRYSHLPAQRSLPRPGDNAVAYSPPDADALGGMISMILDHHDGMPLHGETLSKYLWQGEVATMRDFAAILADKNVNSQNLLKKLEGLTPETRSESPAPPQPEMEGVL